MYEHNMVTQYAAFQFHCSLIFLFKNVSKVIYKRLVRSTNNIGDGGGGCSLVQIWISRSRVSRFELCHMIAFVHICARNYSYPLCCYHVHRFRLAHTVLHYVARRTSEIQSVGSWSSSTRRVGSDRLFLASDIRNEEKTSRKRRHEVQRFVYNQKHPVRTRVHRITRLVPKLYDHQKIACGSLVSGSCHSQFRSRILCDDYGVDNRSSFSGRK